MNVSQPLKLQVIIGSTRQGRFSEKSANWIFEQAKKREGVDVELIDLKDYPLPFFEEPQSPNMSKGTYTNPAITKWTKKWQEADGYIIVTPEYNHGYPAVLKNALDYIYQGWNKKPVGFVSHGSVNGARAVEQLRLVSIELNLAPIKSAIHIPPAVIGSLKNEDLKDTNPFESLNEQAHNFLEQMVWWTKALKTAREEKV